ncbi:MAG TPA: RluA family pseudouridine synthase [Polyangiaceae bacterium]|nr:RluA family pseudouridine synthase [Polyangiaceae bacterium]
MTAREPLWVYEVPASAAGERLDKFLVQQQPELGRQGARWLSEQGLVRVDGARAPKSRRLRAGERVELFGEFAGAPPPEPDLPLTILLERADLVVVDKPAGQPSAPLAPGERGSVAGALLGRFPEMRGVGYRAREPGLLHRLDTRTSGLLLAARTPQSFDVLRAALTAEQLHKRYLAIVPSAVPDSALLEQPLAPDPGGSSRVVLAAHQDVPGARPCRSALRTLERRGRWALVEVAASRAYRHQVRVHLAAAGWPIAGDLEYGGAPVLEGRHALHASHLAFDGSLQLAAFRVDSGLPAELRAVLEGGVAG